MSEMKDRLTKWAANGMPYLVKVKENEQEVEGSYNTLKAIQESWKRLAEYEDAEEQGLLIKLPCKVAEAIDRLFSHNEIIALWYNKPNDKQISYRLWKGMAWDLPQEYKDLRFIRVFGVVSEKISESDTVNLLVTPLVTPYYEIHAEAEKALPHD